MNIFLIEREPYQLRQLKSICVAHADCGEAVCFSSLDEALPRLLSGRPDLVIFDLHSGEMPWNEFVEALNAVCGARFAVTSTETEPRAALLEAGAEAFILKPYLDEQIFSLIDKMAEP